MANSPALEDDVEVASDIDVSALDLNHDESIVVSRAYGRRQTVKALLELVGPQMEAPLNAITALSKKGVLKVLPKEPKEPKETGKSATKKSDETYDYSGVVFSPADLAENCDLTEAQRKRILFVDVNLDKWHHYELLHLERDATASEIKRGYFKVSKTFHPDAFFRKNLGSFGPRIARIFRAMKNAHTVLSDEQQRRAYDQQDLPMSPREKKIAAEKRKQRALEFARMKAADRRREEKKREDEQAKRRQAAEKEAREARQKERLKKRRKGRNPMLERVKKARELMELAESAMQKQKFEEAGRHARMASDFSPSDRDLTARAEDIMAKAGLERAKFIAKRVESSLASSDPEDVIEAAEEIVRLAPADARLLVKAARLANTVKKNQRAMKWAQRATNVDADNKTAWEIIYEIAESEQGWHTALKAAERLLELSPKDSACKQRFKQAKRRV